MSGRVASRRVASRRVASRRVASRRVASRRVASRRVASRRVASRRVASRRVASRRVASRYTNDCILQAEGHRKFFGRPVYPNNTSLAVPVREKDARRVLKYNPFIYNQKLPDNFSRYFEVTFHSVACYIYSVLGDVRSWS